MIYNLVNNNIKGHLLEILLYVSLETNKILSLKATQILRIILKKFCELCPRPAPN